MAPSAVEDASTCGGPGRRWVISHGARTGRRALWGNARTRAGGRAPYRRLGGSNLSLDVWRVSNERAGV
jgi:hypothetical protein